MVRRKDGGGGAMKVGGAMSRAERWGLSEGEGASERARVSKEQG